MFSLVEASKTIEERKKFEENVVIITADDLWLLFVFVLFVIVVISQIKAHITEYIVFCFFLTRN